MLLLKGIDPEPEPAYTAGSFIGVTVMNSHTLLEVQRLANEVRKAAVAFNLVSQAAGRANIVVEVEPRVVQITGGIPQTVITVATRIDPCMVYADPVEVQTRSKLNHEFTQYRLDASPNWIRVQKRQISGKLFYLWTNCSPSFETFEEATEYAAENNLGPLMTEAEVAAFDERVD